MKTNITNLKATLRNLAFNLAKPILRGILLGTSIAIGFLGSALLAVAVNGNIKTWTAGETMTSSDLNTTIASLQAAITSIPDWTKNGSDIIYSGGNVGLASNTPSTRLEVNGTLSFRDNGGKLRNAGILSEVGSQLINIGVNEGSLNRFGGSYTQADQGGMLRIDSRPGSLFAFFARTGGTASSSGIEVVTIQSSGNVGIGTTAPDQLLSVNGNASKASGGTAWAVFSDMRLKDTIQKYDVGLKEVLQINPIIFQYKKANALQLKSGERQVGISAQELQKIIPESVKKSSKDYLQFQMDYVNWALVNSIKELKTLQDKEKAESKKALSSLSVDNDELRNENAELKKRLDRMESVIASIERQANEKMAKK